MPFLPGAVNSVLSQSYPNIELVICDNASTDNTQPYCEELSARDARVRYHRFDADARAPENFARTLHLATGEYFAWISHDDRFAPTFVADCLSALKRNPDSWMCVPAHRLIDEHDRIVGEKTEPKQLGSSDLRTRLKAHLWRRGWLTIYGVGRRVNMLSTPPPRECWGWDAIWTWTSLFQGPVTTIESPLTDYRVFRRKTADWVLNGLTDAKVARWEHIFMWRSLYSATAGMPCSQADFITAHRLLRRWRFTRYYRELLFADLFIEARRLYGRGARIRALGMAVPLLVCSPRKSAEGMLRLLRGRIQP